MKHAAKMAYKIARESGPGNDKEDEYFVDKSEFKNLLINVRRFIELYVAFDTIDTGKDHRIDFDEFLKGRKHLEAWGVPIPKKREEAKAEFDTIDIAKGGIVLFDEFCHWAL